MREMIFQVSGVIAPIMLCVLIGFTLAKARAPFDTKMVGSLVSYVGYPTLIVSRLTGHDTLLDEVLLMMLAGMAMMACFVVIGFFVLKALGLPPRAYLSPMMINNVGNVGLPVCALAFGDEGLVLAMGVAVAVFVGNFTFGVAIPMGKLSFSNLIRQPVIYATVLALVLMAIDTDLPTPIDDAITILGGLAIPLMLLTLGYTLATLTVSDLSRGFILAVIHLVMAVTVASFLSLLFGFEGIARGVFILQCMMPVGIATYLWVERYVPNEASGVAGFILISTILSAASLPAVLAFWVDAPV
jgi:predicted permease